MLSRHNFMDDVTRKELRAWLEFYRELGIEEFYRRAPGSVELPAGVSAVPTEPPVAAPVLAQTHTMARRRVSRRGLSRRHPLLRRVSFR